MSGDPVLAVIAGHPLATGVAIASGASALAATGFGIWFFRGARTAGGARATGAAPPSCELADAEAACPPVATSPAAWAGDEVRHPLLLSPLSVFVSKLRALRRGGASPTAPHPAVAPASPATAAAAHPARALFGVGPAKVAPGLPVSAPGSEAGSDGERASIPAAWPPAGAAGLRSPGRLPPLASSPFWSPSVKRAVAAQARGGGES